MKEPGTRRRRDALTAVTAVVLVVLGAVSAWAVWSLSAGTAQVTLTTQRVIAYQSLQEAVASQAFAEAGYRRSRSPAAELRLDASVQDVSSNVTALRAVTSSGEGAMLSYLELLNDRYVMETRRTLTDSPPSAADGGADDRVAGPALDAVQELVSAAIQVNQDDAAAAVELQRSLVATLAIVLPGVLLIAAAALAVAVRSQRTQSARLVASAADAHLRATHDALTGLLNRAGFDSALPAALKQASPRAYLLLIDVDHFKGVNDAHGHLAGDEVLLEVSARMRGALRPGDILARLGGDEFAVVLQDCDDPLRAGERLCGAVAQPMQLADTVLVPTISVGAVPLGTDQAEQTSSLRRADLALYRAKDAGRARVAT